MTETANLGLPFIDGSQAQKHITHNEALRILDSVVHIGVLDDTLSAPPSSPGEGDRYIIPSGATGAWAGQAKALAVFEDGVWRFFAPSLGWCAWSAASGTLLVYDGTTWSPVADGGGGGSLTGSIVQLGINATATAPNLLTLASNAALFKAIAAADGGTGDMRLQISKEGSANTASVIFSDSLSGCAEFGLVGSDQFKLKVSGDGITFTEAMTFDQATGNATFARGLSLTGVIATAQITADQDDYDPAGLAAASVVNLSVDAAHSLSGLAGGAEGRVVSLLNTGSQVITLLNESAASSAANRFAIGGDVAVGAKQAVLLRYDGTAARWYALARPVGGGGSFTPATQAQQETGTDNTVCVTPDVQQFHPSAAKAWAKISGGSSPALLAGYNVSSISRVSAGIITINFTVPFSDANYVVVGSGGGTSNSFVVDTANAQTASSVTIRAFLTSGTSADPGGGYNVICFGDQ